MSAQLDEVNSRIDNIIRSNSHIEKIILAALAMSFLVGTFALIYGAVEGNRWILAAGLGANGLICWSALKLLEFYRLKLCVALVPQMTALLSEKDAAAQVSFLIRRLIKNS